MQFSPNEIYHIYNRGNNHQLIFFNNDNYIFFLKKVREEWKKYGDILCYCLMPNHFHFMFAPNEDACKNIYLGDKLTHIQNLSKAIGKTLSSYTKAINLHNKTTGNLFQKKTKAKYLADEKYPHSKFTKRDYLLTCFHYIHYNPKHANLVNEIKDWQFSSYLDYYGYLNGTLCYKILAVDLMELSDKDLKEDVYGLNEKIIDLLF